MSVCVCVSVKKKLLNKNNDNDRKHETLIKYLLVINVTNAGNSLQANTFGMIFATINN